jgi:DegV family protein with EDD domain
VNGSLTAANTAIVVDSTADFPEAPRRYTNWRIVPLYVRFGNESYRDYVELGPAEFYRRLRDATEPPTTSQPTPADFLETYRELLQFDRIYSLHIAGTLSGTVESARTAATEFGERVRIVDTTTASAAVAMLGLAIQRRLVRGTSEEEIESVVERHRRSSALVFTLDTLDYLARGGRIGRAAAWAGEMLKVKPILTITDGEVVPLKRVRGNRRAFQEFAARLEAGSDDRPELRTAIAHADAPDRADALKDMVRRTRPKAQLELVTTLGPVVGTHAGPGTVGFFWFTDV